MADFAPGGSDWTKPAIDGFAIAAGSGTPLVHPTRGLFFNTGVTSATVTLLNGSSVTLASPALGVVHPLACTHVTALAGGTAVGLY